MLKTPGGFRFRLLSPVYLGRVEADVVGGEPPRYYDFSIDASAGKAAARGEHGSSLMPPVQNRAGHKGKVEGGGVGNPVRGCDLAEVVRR